MRVILFVFVFSVLAVSLPAQDTEDYDEYMESKRIHTDFKESLFSIRAAVTLPAPVSNRELKEKFRGIYEFNISANMRLFAGFFAGLGFKNSLLGTNRIPNPVSGLYLNTKMQLNTPYVKLGYNHFHNENVFSTIALNAGYTSGFFTNVVNVNNPVLDKTYTSVLIEPEYSINFAVEENFAFGIFVSYSYLATPFNPYNIALQDVTSIVGNTNKATGIISFGFGFYVGMGKKFTRRN